MCSCNPIMIPHHPEEQTAMARQADRDGDGLINPDEFYRVMRKWPGDSSGFFGVPVCQWY